MTTYMRIPATYENETLTIKALGLTHTAYPMEEAYMALAKNTPEHYAALALGTIKEEGRFIGITIPFNEKLYNKILEIEPLPVDKKRIKVDSHLHTASAEEVIKHGY